MLKLAVLAMRNGGTRSGKSLELSENMKNLEEVTKMG